MFMLSELFFQAVLYVRTYQTSSKQNTLAGAKEDEVPTYPICLSLPSTPNVIREDSIAERFCATPWNRTILGFKAGSVTL